VEDIDIEIGSSITGDGCQIDFKDGIPFLCVQRGERVGFEGYTGTISVVGLNEGDWVTVSDTFNDNVREWRYLVSGDNHYLAVVYYGKKNERLYVYKND